MSDIFSCNAADGNQRPDPEIFPTQSVQTFLYQYWYVLWTVWHQCWTVLIQTATEVTHWKSINTQGTTIRRILVFTSSKSTESLYQSHRCRHGLESAMAQYNLGGYRSTRTLTKSYHANSYLDQLVPTANSYPDQLVPNTNSYPTSLCTSHVASYVYLLLSCFSYQSQSIIQNFIGHTQSFWH